MLDNMIKLMETIVAMEDLQNADENADNKLALDEIFDFGDSTVNEDNLDQINNFTKKYKESINKLLEWANGKEGEEFKKSAQDMKVSWKDGMTSVWDLLNTSEEDLQKLTKE
jgi:hypothetical protein